VSKSSDAAVLALSSIEGFSDDEREAVVECLKTGRARVVAAREGPATAVTVLANRAFTWPEFDRWQAIFAASGTFPARWDGLQVVPVPQTSRDARAAYGLRKLDLLFEWLDALTRGAAALGHYTRQGMRARIVRQEAGQRCPVCESFNGHEVRHRRDTMPPIHPGCRCVLMAVTAVPNYERIGTHARHRLRASS
jgi:hypothetical protein